MFKSEHTDKVSKMSAFTTWNDVLVCGMSDGGLQVYQLVPRELGRTECTMGGRYLSRADAPRNVKRWGIVDVKAVEYSSGSCHVVSVNSRGDVDIWVIVKSDEEDPAVVKARHRCRQT